MASIRPPAFWTALTLREKGALSLGTLGVALFLLYQFAWLPLAAEQSRRQRAISAKSEALIEMYQLQADYTAAARQAEAARSRFARRPRDFTLFSFLDRSAGDAGIKENIAYMKPSSTQEKTGELQRSRVEMKLQAVTLKQITNFLHQVETSENLIFVTKMAVVKSGKEENFIDVTLMLETFIP